MICLFLSFLLYFFLSLFLSFFSSLFLSLFLSFFLSFFLFFFISYFLTLQKFPSYCESMDVFVKLLFNKTWRLNRFVSVKVRVLLVVQLSIILLVPPKSEIIMVLFNYSFYQYCDSLIAIP